MARWKPLSDPLQPNEHVGRRLFDEPKLSGAPDQKPWAGLDLRNFIENRSKEFSMDRLGASGIDKRVVRYLQSRAEHAAASYAEPKSFDGWAYAKVRTITEVGPDSGWTISPSPDTGSAARVEETQWDDANTAQNQYHAHISMPETLGSYQFALAVREKFSGIIDKVGEIKSAL